MRRLYLQIYLAFVGILALFGVMVSLAWWLLPTEIQTRGSVEGMSAVLSEVLPAPGRPRVALMDKLRGESLEAFDRSLDVHVSRIRAAIEDDPKHPRRIITVRGAGYVFAKQQDV